MSLICIPVAGAQAFSLSSAPGLNPHRWPSTAEMVANQPHPLPLQPTLLAAQGRWGSSCRRGTQQCTLEMTKCVQAHVSLYQAALQWKYQHGSIRSLFLPQEQRAQLAYMSAPRRVPHGSVCVHRTVVPSGYATPGEQSGHCTARQKQQRAESLVPAFAPQRKGGAHWSLMVCSTRKPGGSEAVQVHRICRLQLVTSTHRRLKLRQ